MKKHIAKRTKSLKRSKATTTGLPASPNTGDGAGTVVGGNVNWMYSGVISRFARFMTEIDAFAVSAECTVRADGWCGLIFLISPSERVFATNSSPSRPWG